MRLPGRYWRWWRCRRQWTSRTRFSGLFRAFQRVLPGPGLLREFPWRFLLGLSLKVHVRPECLRCLRLPWIEWLPWTLRPCPFQSTSRCLRSLACTFPWKSKGRAQCLRISQRSSCWLTCTAGTTSFSQCRKFLCRSQQRGSEEVRSTSLSGWKPHLIYSRCQLRYLCQRLLKLFEIVFYFRVQSLICSILNYLRTNGSWREHCRYSRG